MMTNQQNEQKDNDITNPYHHGFGAAQPHTEDEGIYDSYGEFINPAYPPFLRKIGLNHSAVKAEGATITDSEGRAYIDCVGGYGIANLGHNHPVLVQSLVEQLYEKRLGTRPFITDLPVQLAKTLSAITGGELTCSFVCNSGSEAIDNAVKLARLHKGKKHIIAAQGSFHGYTCGALSVSGIPSFKRLFEPLIPQIEHVPFGEIRALENAVTDNTAAILLEPIQHEAGIFLPPPGYFQEVRRLCDEKGIILILDEVKTGLGKTGRMFAYHHWGIVPDVLVLGKSLGGGLIPIGALVAKRNLWKKFGLSFSMSASSYAWNTLACRAALTSIDLLQQGNLMEECASKGQALLSAFRDMAGQYPHLLTSVNGLGLLVGLETVHPGVAIALSREMVRQGVITMQAFGKASVLMFEPPLVISFDQIKEIIQSLKKSCEILHASTRESYAGL